MPTSDEAPALADLSPMLATARAHAFDDPAWIFEPKHDGYRLLAETGSRLRLHTRGGHDATAWFPELHAPLTAIAAGGRHVVDGEVVVLDDFGRSDFEALHARAARRGWKPGASPVVYCIFDLLVHEARSVMHWPLLERKRLLQALVGKPTHYLLLVDHVAEKGRAMFAAASQMQLEGVVAKRADSAYRPGERSPDWLKIKRPGAVPPERFKRR